MTSKQAKESLNNFFVCCGGVTNLTEFDAPLLHDCNVNVIEALEMEHPRAVRFFRYNPPQGEKHVTRYHKGEKIYNFAADMVIPSDVPQYAKFKNAVRRFIRNGESIDTYKDIANACRACGGDILVWR